MCDLYHAYQVFATFDHFFLANRMKFSFWLSCIHSQHWQIEVFMHDFFST